MRMARTARFGTADLAMPEVAIRFADRGVALAIVRNPGLGAAEMFMDGRLVIEAGDIRGLITLLKGNTLWEAGRKSIEPILPLRMLGRVSHRVDRINMARRAKKNVAHHYDLSDRLYDLFLDADWQYSCAYFTDPANTLDRAQDDKKAHIAAKLALLPGMRVLDIGCGWGGMALYLHAKTGAEVLGVTLSEEQIKVARRRAEAAGVADKVKFELIDYRHVTGSFDRIVSVGMFEHVGPAHYRAFFRKCRDLLTRDGVMLIHTIGRMGKPGVTDDFTAKYIFPGGYNPALSEIVRGYEGMRMFPTDIEVLRVALRADARSLVRSHHRCERRDRGALRRALLPHVVLLSRRREYGVPLRRPGQLPAPDGEEPRCFADHARLYDRCRTCADRRRRRSVTARRFAGAAFRQQRRDAIAGRGRGRGRGCRGGRIVGVTAGRPLAARYPLAQFARRQSVKSGCGQRLFLRCHPKLFRADCAQKK